MSCDCKTKKKIKNVNRRISKQEKVENKTNTKWIKYSIYTVFVSIALLIFLPFVMLTNKPLILKKK